MEKKFIALFKEALDMDGKECQMKDVFREYDDWDSLALLSLIAMMDEEYGVQIELDELSALETVADLYNEISKRAA